jgi:hypothetical protein
MVCEKNFFVLMASQNIPSQSCTHLLRILLVMAEVLVMLLVMAEVLVMLLVMAEVLVMFFDALSKDFSTSLVVGLLLQHAKSGCYQTIQALPLLLMLAGLKHPSSSSFAFVKLLCLHL